MYGRPLMSCVQYKTTPVDMHEDPQKAHRKQDLGTTSTTIDWVEPRGTINLYETHMPLICEICHRC